MGSLRQTSRAYRRAGVTLTELLVVISVIVVLVGLTFTMFEAAQRATDRIHEQVASANPHFKKRAPRVPPTQTRWIPNQYLVTFKGTVTNPQKEADRLATSVPAVLLNVYSTALKGCSVRIQPGDVDALKADPAVGRVEQDQYVYACKIPTGVSRIQYAHAPIPPPFTISFPGAGIGNSGTTVGGSGPRNLNPGTTIGGSSAQPPLKAVAIMDTGIDSTHPDLNVVFSKGFGNPNGEDQNSHGTHVAGTVGAKGIGVTGVFPGVPLWSLRVLGANGSGSGADILAGLDFAAKNASQINVLNMSLGTGSVVQAINDATTACVNAGIVVCVAAGNSSDLASGHSPASASQVICVAAYCDTDGLIGGKGPVATTGDADDTFAAAFSSFGPAVGMIAPGVDIYSTFPVSMGSYSFDTGTSMATPHVAGMCALVLSNSPTTIPTGSNPRNVTGPGSPVLITNPAQVLGFLQQEAVEFIPGDKVTNKDNRTYPLLTGRP
jgi:subtilisin family serine protease